MFRLFFDTFDTAKVPLATEEWVEAHIDGFELFGRVDRIDSLPDGSLEIIDYKTGRFMWEPEDLPRETARQFYVLGVEEKYGMRVERVRIIYLRKGHEVRWSPGARGCRDCARAAWADDRGDPVRGGVRGNAGRPMPSLPVRAHVSGADASRPRFAHPRGRSAFLGGRRGLRSDFARSVRYGERDRRSGLKQGSNFGGAARKKRRVCRDLSSADMGGTGLEPVIHSLSS
jgi:hypothetical protein